MPTAAEVPSIVGQVKLRLAEAENQGTHLRVAGEKLDDDWLYVTVEPTQAGIRASEHANFMSAAERELRAAGSANVILVPAIND